MPRHRKASDWALDHIRDSILSGRLTPGEPLLLIPLSTQMGLSTTPVREALVRLKSEGLVEGDARRTFRVAELSLRDVFDHYRLHATFSGMIAERATETLTGEDIAYLRKLDSEMLAKVESGDYEDMYDLNRLFHQRINSVATGVLRRFTAITARLVARRTYPDVIGYKSTIHDHAAIIDAMESRDGTRARELTEAHVLQVGEALIAELRDRGWS